MTRPSSTPSGPVKARVRALPVAAVAPPLIAALAALLLALALLEPLSAGASADSALADAIELTTARTADAADAAGAVTGVADPEVTRLSGPDRFATAAAISADAFPQDVRIAYVATGERFPDALAAAPVAAGAGGPVLLAGRGFLPEPTRRELQRLTPSEVVVLGGADAVEDAVVSAIREATGADVRRVAGADRFATAAALSAAAFEPVVSRVVLASGADFPDALAGGAAAGVAGVPVLLVTRDAIPPATAEELRRLDPRRVEVLGGTGAVSDAVAAEAGRLTGAPVDRRAGRNRFETAAALSAAAFADGADVVHLATGLRFADALSGAPVAALAGGPVLLSRPDCVPRAVLDEIARLGADRVVLLGGSDALGAAVERLAGCDRETTVVVDGLSQPWDVAHTPDGRAWITERDSRRLLVRETDGTVRTVQQLEARTGGEGGVLGLAVSPTFAEDGLLYVYLTSNTDNRVVRLRPGSAPEPVLIGIPRAQIHNGGRIAFGPDGMLYVGTGDAAQPSSAQDPGSLGGKILRVTPDGDVPDDNPTGTAVWSLGHRNVQGLAWDADGQLYATELGPDRDDEVNRIEPGGNYGWPTVTGRAGDPRFRDPVAVNQPAEASWSGATFLDGGAVGPWEGDLFVAALRGQRLWRFRLDSAGTGVAEAEALLVGEHGRLRQVRQAPDGSLWVVTGNGSGDRILRIGPPG